MKRPNWQSLADAEMRALEKAGYTVWEEYPWHWVVSKYEGDIKAHVWPTVGKYMAYFDSGASYYSNKDQLVEAMDRIFNFKATMPEATEDQIEFQKQKEKAQKMFMDDWGEDEDRTVADIDQI